MASRRQSGPGCARRLADADVGDVARRAWSGTSGTSRGRVQGQGGPPRGGAYIAIRQFASSPACQQLAMRAPLRTWQTGKLATFESRPAMRPFQSSSDGKSRPSGGHTSR
jgi:hypothetical protein